MLNAPRGVAIVVEPVSVLGVRIDPFTEESLLACIGTLCARHAHEVIPYVNVHGLNLAYELPWLRTFFNNAAHTTCDGAGVRLGAWLSGQVLPPRITNADFLWKLADYAATQGLSMFFLGAARGVGEQASDKLLERTPSLRIVGVHHGYFDKTRGGKETTAVLDAIREANPDILYVAFGMPMQEQWLVDNWLDVKAHVVLTGGAILDYIAGCTPRGPRWLTDTGFEWLVRLAIEPKRLWRRYLIGNPLFIARILRQRWVAP